jgi:F-type H+-transporting ATPase subunit a
MDKLHHEIWIVHAVNTLLGPVFAALLRPFGYDFAPGEQVIPDYLVMGGLILVGVTVLCLVVRSRLSIENPGKLQITLEEVMNGFNTILTNIVGPKGPRFLPIVATMGIFIWTGNMMGLVPGLMAPTSNINVTLGCALTVWVYYHIQGAKEQGIGAYLKHFAAPPGAPLFIAPIMLPIEIISHLSRVMSLSLRLFGNVFGEELVILILFTIVPFLIPLPMMALGIITGTLQAFIFVMLTMIYLGGAVAVEHEKHHAEEEHHAAELASVPLHH